MSGITWRATAIALFSILLSGCCVKTLKTTVGVDPVTGAKLTSEVDFLTTAQCEVQRQIKGVMKEFARRAARCAEAADAVACRTRANEEYEPTISFLLDINARLSTRGIVTEREEDFVEQAKQAAKKYRSPAERTATP